MIRAATAADAAEVGRLLTLLGYPTTEAVARQRLEAFLDPPRDVILLCEGGDAAVGLIGLSTIPRLAEGGCRARITNLVVDPEAQRRGIGRALVEAAEQHAIGLGCNVIEVSSGLRPEREAAHRFYPALGYADAGVHHVLYERQLGSGAPRREQPLTGRRDEHRLPR